MKAGEVLVITSNYAAAYAAKLARVEVISAYPITPQTTVVEKLAEFIEKGELKAKMIRVESEHSAMASCIGASAAGARVFTATSSHGLLYMYEMLWWAAGARLPIVMGVVTRAIAPPWTIWTEHADILSPRDSGWLILFAENAQEVLDMIIQAYRISEDHRILLPVMVGWDAFISSHTAEPVSLPPQNKVDEFLPPPGLHPIKLDVKNPFSHGNLTYPEYYMEFRYLIQRSMEDAKKVIKEVDERYGEITGRRYGGLVETYRCDDAEHVIVTVGAASGDAKEAVDYLKSRGLKVGLCRLRSLRPYPEEEIVKLLEDKESVIVIERDNSMGLGGIIAREIASTVFIYDLPLNFASFIAGLGGREVSSTDVKNMVNIALHKFSRGVSRIKDVWYGLRREVLP
ncbi:MAG: pyruvate ferredoxin oxidoreductase [Thermoproteales archaeon]|nr:pyruvate ferredoxin oxidoreductase [Thermoproteales archaeon]RLE64212.1 MAG: pyruvate ferredoxin oxidoreductase [Thermoprotei archaeon]